MLTYKLYKFFRIDKLKKERSVLTDCRGPGEGIWDILGYYDPLKYEITICDSRIEEFAKSLAISINSDETTTTLVLRELVRLHEHAHSLLHTGKISSVRRFRKGYRNLPREINEPVTEFIAWSTIKKFGTKFIEKVFEEIDKKSPKYYRNWRKIKQKIDSKSKIDERFSGSIQYISFIPSLISIVRRGICDDFNSFLRKIDENWNTILTGTLAFRL